MDSKNGEKKEACYGFCGGFFSRCYSNRIVRVLLSVFIVFALFSLGVSFGSHMVSRYSQVNGERGFFAGRHGARACQGEYQEKNGRGSQRGNRGGNFMMRGQRTQVQGGDAQGQYQRGRMMNNNQLGSDGLPLQSPVQGSQTNGVNPSTSTPAPEVPNVQ